MPIDPKIFSQPISPNQIQGAWQDYFDFVRQEGAKNRAESKASMAVQMVFRGATNAAQESMQFISDVEQQNNRIEEGASPAPDLMNTYGGSSQRSASIVSRCHPLPREEGRGVGHHNPSGMRR